MSAGQVLCLTSGSYQSITQSSANTFTASGSFSNPIIVTSAPGQTATIQGADYINGDYVTFEYLNLDQADTLYNGNGGSNPAPCTYPLSEGMQINGSHVTIQDDNVYESKYRGVLIGIDYAGSPSDPSVGDVIRNDNLGPAGGCSDSQHLIYADYTSDLQVYDNWFSDDPYGFGVQLYQSDTNASIHSNVFDNVLDATIEASPKGGNITQHNVAINPAQVAVWKRIHRPVRRLLHRNQRYNRKQRDLQRPRRVRILPHRITVTGSTTLTTNPFTGSKNSDNYRLAPTTTPPPNRQLRTLERTRTPHPQPRHQLPHRPHQHRHPQRHPRPHRLTTNPQRAVPAPAVFRQRRFSCISGSARGRSVGHLPAAVT